MREVCVVLEVLDRIGWPPYLAQLGCMHIKTPG